MIFKTLNSSTTNLKRFTLLIACAFAVLLFAVSSASAQTQTVRDGSTTSLSPTNLVFDLQNGNTLVIQYDASTNVSIINAIKAKGLLGNVACQATVNGSTVTATGSVVWLKSKTSATVNLSTVPTATILSCSLSQYADSSPPVIVFFDAQQASQQAIAVEVARLPHVHFHAKKGSRQKTLPQLVKYLQKRDKKNTYEVAPKHASQTQSGIIYVLRGQKGEVVLLQKLSNGQFAVTIFSKFGTSSHQIVTTFAKAHKV
jgi:hypothetical protein